MYCLSPRTPWLRRILFLFARLRLQDLVTVTPSLSPTSVACDLFYDLHPSSMHAMALCHEHCWRMYSSSGTTTPIYGSRLLAHALQHLTGTARLSVFDEDTRWIAAFGEVKPAPAARGSVRHVDSILPVLPIQRCYSFERVAELLAFGETMYVDYSSKIMVDAFQPNA